jgi:hypothetical protein
MTAVEHTSTTIQLTGPQSGRIKRRHFLALLLIFLVSTLSLVTVYVLFPKIDPYVDRAVHRLHFTRRPFSTERDAFKVPKTIDDAKILGDVLYKYSKHHRYIIMIAFFLTYIL